MKTAWPHLRAGLVLAHLVVVFVVAFPAPVGGLDRTLWKDPTAQQEFASWAKFFHVAEPDFEEFLYQAAVKYMNGRDAIMGPFVRYVAWTGCDQPWRMFVGPQRFPSRLQVQAHRAGRPADEWETLFFERDPATPWHAELFGQERLRSQIFRWAWPNFSDEYQQGCAYFARLEFAEAPDVDQVRCRFWRTQSASPEQVRSHTEPPGAWADARTIARPAGAAR